MKPRKIRTLVLTVLLCLVFLTTSIGHAQDTEDVTIHTSASIIASPSIANLKFSTDFEDLTWAATPSVQSGMTEGRLNLKDRNSQYYMYNTVVLQGYGELFIDDGTAYSDSPTPHSGSTMIGGGIPADSTIRRAQLDVWFTRTNEPGTPPTPWIVDQYFLRVWYYFSPDWALTSTNVYNCWASLCTIQNTAGGSYQFVLTVRAFHAPPVDPINDYKLCIGNVGEAHVGGPVETTPATWNVANIRGRWNLLEIFVRQGPQATGQAHAQNWCTVWWDGVKILDAGGFPTLEKAWATNTPWYVSIPKVYTDISSAANRQWLDDLEIWDDIPSPPL